MNYEIKQCPEFPFFGASYPDARCIDGYLWDLDWCDENGRLTKGGEYPCPFCNSEESIQMGIDDEEGTREEIIIQRDLFWKKYDYTP
ncbi:hypothetical protein [Pedobacter punctiformis]|uniref:Uncharacterized protein n=1 Tax=Pedobacter punctiformis TaxID=3004097 RepID=A0ABT4LAL6_9SPHI|nr:hypothetical protein [Pedobacter sp. HCMS5-2]MCZ4244966.1 hypothetical protein [Pedobacter sp. HCMS5-2]